MIGAIKKLLSLKTDQECLIKQMEQWRKELPEDHIYIYIYISTKGSATVENIGKCYNPVYES